jgi:hypothetical protein
MRIRLNSDLERGKEALSVLKYDVRAKDIAEQTKVTV